MLASSSLHDGNGDRTAKLCRQGHAGASCALAHLCNWALQLRRHLSTKPSGQLEGWGVMMKACVAQRLALDDVHSTLRRGPASRS